MKMILVLASAIAFAMPLAVRADEAALTRAYLAASDGEWREALGWFEVAAEAGDLRAQETVAWMYLNGAALYPGVERNVPLAKAWYYRAEALGSRTATRILAKLDGAPTGTVAAIPENRAAR